MSQNNKKNSKKSRRVTPGYLEEGVVNRALMTEQEQQEFHDYLLGVRMGTMEQGDERYGDITGHLQQFDEEKEQENKQQEGSDYDDNNEEDDDAGPHHEDGEDLEDDNIEGKYDDDGNVIDDNNQAGSYDGNVWRRADDNLEDGELDEEEEYMASSSSLPPPTHPSSSHAISASHFSSPHQSPH